MSTRLSPDEPLVDHRDRRLTQIEIDHLELASTQVSPGTARFLSLAFAFILFAVPVSQALVEISRRQSPQALDLFAPVATGIRRGVTGDVHGWWSAWRDGLRPATLHAYEAAVAHDSSVAAFSQPRVQQILSRWFRAGNDKVVLGRDGWAFYLPGLMYVAGPSVAERATFDRLSQEMVNKGTHVSPHPDPRPALLAFDRASRKAGIHLIVMPVPDKAMLQPAQLAGGTNGAGDLPVANNAGYSRLVEEMRASGIDWFDPVPPRVRPTDVRYLAQDTHWTPEYMDSVARDLAGHILRTGVLPAAPLLPLRLVGERVSHIGDLVDMLKLTKDQGIFAPEAVTIRRVVDERSGQPLAPDPGSSVMLLGDSFTNIYTEPAMGWGSGAGFGPHLAYHLRRPVDVIALNGGGASQVRAELARPDNAVRLGSKKVIIYQFAIRNLLIENWEPLPMVTPDRPRAPAAIDEGLPAAAVRGTKPSQSRPIEPPALKTPPPSNAAGTRLVVVGRITQTSKVPAPGTAPYKDCLTFIKVRVEAVESGVYRPAEMLVVFVAMRDNHWLPAASYTVGDQLRMQLIPFGAADPEIRGLQRADDTDEYTLRPYYVLQESRK